MSQWKMDKYERDLLFDLVYAQNSVLSELVAHLGVHVVKDNEFVRGRLDAMQETLRNTRVRRTSGVEEN